MFFFFFLLIAVADASFLPVIIQPITNYTNSPALPCPTSCPVELLSGNATEDILFFANTTFRRYPNATDFYLNGTQITNSSVLALLSDDICYAQPTYMLLLNNLSSMPCNTIKRRDIEYLTFTNVSGLASLNETSVFNVAFYNMPHLQEIDVTLLSHSEDTEGIFYLDNLEVLRTIRLTLLGGRTNIQMTLCPSVQYFNYTTTVIYGVNFQANNNLMGVVLKEIGFGGFGVSFSAAFERIDISNRTINNASGVAMDTKSERFLNSRPNCVGDFTGNASYFIEYCLPVQNAPPRNPDECTQPIVERCISSLYYNESCWIPEWNVTTFNITSPVTVKDCVFDANHWFNVSTLYLYDASIALPTRVRAQTIVYLNTLAPTKNPSKSPSKNPTMAPSNNPSLNPTPAPSNNPSRNPSKNPSRNPTNVR